MKNPVDPALMTPWTMFTDAKYYRIAAEVLIKSATAEDATALLRTQLILPTMNLVSMSVESALKSYLYANGIEPNVLKDRYGHDLVHLRRKAETFSKDKADYLVREVKPLLDLLNDPYKAKQFQYRIVGEMRVPTPEHLCQWITQFMDEIRPFVKERTQAHLESLGVHGQSLE